MPHLGGYSALGSLSESLTRGIPAVSAVAGFNSQALYQHILSWFGYRPNISYIHNFLKVKSEEKEKGDSIMF